MKSANDKVILTFISFLKNMKCYELYKKCFVEHGHHGKNKYNIILFLRINSYDHYIRSAFSWECYPNNYHDFWATINARWLALLKERERMEAYDNFRAMNNSFLKAVMDKQIETHNKTYYDNNDSNNWSYGCWEMVQQQLRLH